MKQLPLMALLLVVGCGLTIEARKKRKGDAAGFAEGEMEGRYGKHKKGGLMMPKKKKIPVKAVETPEMMTREMMEKDSVRVEAPGVDVEEVSIMREPIETIVIEEPVPRS